MWKCINSYHKLFFFYDADKSRMSVSVSKCKILFQNWSILLFRLIIRSGIAGWVGCFIHRKSFISSWRLIHDEISSQTEENWIGFSQLGEIVCILHSCSFCITINHKLCRWKTCIDSSFSIKIFFKILVEYHERIKLSVLMLSSEVLVKDIKSADETMFHQQLRWLGHSMYYQIPTNPTCHVFRSRCKLRGN